MLAASPALPLSRAGVVVRLSGELRFLSADNTAIVIGGHVGITF